MNKIDTKLILRPIPAYCEGSSSSDSDSYYEAVQFADPHQLGLIGHQTLGGTKSSYYELFSDLMSAKTKQQFVGYLELPTVQACYSQIQYCKYKKERCNLESVNVDLPPILRPQKPDLKLTQSLQRQLQTIEKQV